MKINENGIKRADMNSARFRLLTKYNIFIVFVKMYKGLLRMPSSERKGDRAAVEGACVMALF